MDMEKNSTVVVLGVTAVVLVITFFIYKQMGSSSASTAKKP